MNRQSIIEPLETIRDAIESAGRQNPNKRLQGNYEAGIRLCNELIAELKVQDIPTTFEGLMGRFNRFVSDSLPWTDPLLATIDKETKRIELAIRAAQDETHP